MSTYPAPTRKVHRTFCETEGWQLARKATGGAVDHHVTYRLPLADGRILRTRISRPVDKETYGAGIWRRILRDQLDVDESTFWGCVRDGVLPTRGAPPPPAGGVPVELFRLLVARAGLSETEVLAMTREEAIRAASDYWSRADPSAP